ncbi:hypothetical protein D3C80_1836050 [compost metagenome]
MRRAAGMALKRFRIMSGDRLILAPSGIQVAGRRFAACAAFCSSPTVLKAPLISFIRRRVSDRSRAVGLRGMRLAEVRNA